MKYLILIYKHDIISSIICFNDVLATFTFYVFVDHLAFREKKFTLNFIEF